MLENFCANVLNYGWYTREVLFQEHAPGSICRQLHVQWGAWCGSLLHIKVQTSVSKFFFNFLRDLVSKYLTGLMLWSILVFQPFWF